MKTTPPGAPVPPVLKLICQALDDKKAEQVRVLNVSEQSSITDYLVVATGTSDPHLRALRVEIEKILDANAVHIVGMDTSQESGWLVVDAFDIMIHVLTPTNRELYGLENLWKDAIELPLGNVPIKQAKPKAKAPAKPRAKKPATSKTKKVAPAAKSPAKKTSAKKKS